MTCLQIIRVNSYKENVLESSCENGARSVTRRRFTRVTLRRRNEHIPSQSNSGAPFIGTMSQTKASDAPLNAESATASANPAAETPTLLSLPPEILAAILKFLPELQDSGCIALASRDLLEASRGFWLDKAKQAKGDANPFLQSLGAKEALDCTTRQLVTIIASNFGFCDSCNSVTLLENLNEGGDCPACHEPSEESDHDDDDDESEGSNYCVECGDEIYDSRHSYCDSCWNEQCGSCVVCGRETDEPYHRYCSYHWMGRRW